MSDGAVKLSYDSNANVAYLRFHEKRGTVTTLKISDEVNIDLAADGSIYGIELLNANEQLDEDHGRLIVETGGRRQEFDLAARLVQRHDNLFPAIAIFAALHEATERAIQGKRGKPGAAGFMANREKELLRLERQLN